MVQALKVGKDLSLSPVYNGETWKPFLNHELIIPFQTIRGAHILPSSLPYFSFFILPFHSLSFLSILYPSFKFFILPFHSLSFLTTLYPSFPFFILPSHSLSFLSFLYPSFPFFILPFHSLSFL